MDSSEISVASGRNSLHSSRHQNSIPIAGITGQLPGPGIVPRKAPPASWGGDLGGCIHRLCPRESWAVPRRHGNRNHWENPRGCCTVTSVAPSMVLLLPSVGQSVNIFLPISEAAPGEESHYLNINSLCGLSCNKAGVRRC